jgi:hypothetical protein
LGVSVTSRRARNRRDKRAPLPTERQAEQPLPPDWWIEMNPQSTRQAADVVNNKPEHDNERTANT